MFAVMFIAFLLRIQTFRDEKYYSRFFWQWLWTSKSSRLQRRA